MDAPTAAFDGEFFVRAALRRARHTADPKNQPAIDNALADPVYVPDTAAQLMAQFSASGSSGGVAGFLALLYHYLPQILAFIALWFPA